MNRFIYVIADRKERKVLRTEPLTKEERKEAKEIEDFLKALAKRTSVTILEMTTEAKKIYDSYEEQIEKQIAEEHLDIKESYCGQLPNLVIRLSCLYRLSRMTPLEIKNYSDAVLTVAKEDVERAINYAQKAWTWFEKIIEIMHTRSAEASDTENEIDSVILMILEDGEEHNVELILQSVKEMEVKACKATIYNRLKKLEKEGKVTHSKHGFFKLAKEADDSEGKKK
jgi:hypothetical protein